MKRTLILSIVLLAAVGCESSKERVEDILEFRNLCEEWGGVFEISAYRTDWTAGIEVTCSDVRGVK